MKELKELRFNENNILLKDNIVHSSILPQKASELSRNITVQGDTVIEGPVFAHKMEIQNGNLEIQGSVFTQLELYVNSEASGDISFMKSVASSSSIVSRASKCNISFHSDVNAQKVTLYNAFVGGSIYADEVVLENCVVIGGVFATIQLDLTNCIVGTFNTPSVRIEQSVSLLLPSAFSIEKMLVAPGAKLFNLSLADLGSLYKGLPQSPESGKIEMKIDTDEIKSTLVDDEVQKSIRSYTVVGKVLAADLIDMEKFQNHFLLTAASLGSQLLKTYDLGVDKDGKPAVLEFNRIRDFFFDILNGKFEIQDINGTFNISDITNKF